MAVERSCAVDMNRQSCSLSCQFLQELEAQAQKALQEGRKLHEQRLQQVQALQRVEAAAKASLEGGDSGRTTRRPSSDGAGPSGEAVDPAAAARAAARIAAESFDPDRAGGTALRDTGTGSNATAANAEAGGDEVRQCSILTAMPTTDLVPVI